MKQQFLKVGKITNVHGLMGEMRVQPWADSPDFLCQFKTLYVDKTHWPIRVERARVHKNMVILKLEGVTDVNSAMAMRNAILYIDRKDAHEILGNIADVLTLPANNVYVVRGGAREILIPAVDEFVAEVDLDGSCMRVNMVEGL